MPTAIVTGATGILGREIVAELSKDSATWSKVYALSRSNKDAYPSNVEHAFIDLQASADRMAKDLAHVKAEYVFFSAYVQKESEQESWDVNGDMLQNFLTALQTTGAASSLKRVILVTGCKQYGVHLGAAKNPMVESDPWLRDPKWPPNFYYRQQDILREFCTQNPHVSWVVTYPNDVIGFAKGNYMNLATSLGLYAAVTRELQGGSNSSNNGAEITFPGSPAFYTKFDCFTDSRLHARFCAWAALEPRAANQAFNVVNGDTESWQSLFPRVARRFGLRVKPDQLRGPLPGAEGSVMELAERSPLSDVAVELGLVGSDAVARSRVEQLIDLLKWSQREDVRQAWRRLAQREGLEEDSFDRATWAFLGFILGRNYDIVISMSKARKLGWNEYKDTWESLSETFDKLEKAKILPKDHR